MNAAFNAAALPNLENMSQLQQREISAPVAFALRNADADDKRLENRLSKVNEMEETDGIKAINPDERREQEQQKKKKKQGEQRRNRGLENGRFVDFSA